MSAPGGPPPVNPVDLTALLEEALAIYDHVLVDTGPWLTRTAQTGRDRLDAARPALALARQALVFARATPDGATQLVEWRSAAHDNGLEIPVFAVLGQRGHRYERSHLAHMLEVNTSWPNRSPACTSCPRTRSWPKPDGTPSSSPGAVVAVRRKLSCGLTGPCRGPGGPACRRALASWHAQAVPRQ